MEEKLLNLKKSALHELEGIHDSRDLETFRIKHLGKKGEVTSVLKGLGDLPGDKRPAIGKLANQIKADLVEAMKVVEERIRENESISQDLPDVTLPGRRPPRGHLHPISLVNREICDILIRMGYKIVEGPDVELDYYNFEALNFPKDHPARDMQDTFYVSENVVLRTQTSGMQVRVMEKQKPMFHQVEGLLVDRGVTFGDLKGTLTGFVHQLFGSKTAMRFRPSFFPFTEPSAEVDIQCVMCRGKGCRTCSYSGWLEILGSGMVDPAVYGFVDYDPEIYSGFAFGIGIERTAMLLYGIDDIQLFFRNDMRFLRQF